MIKEYEAPGVHLVAQAIARKYNWTISPSGKTALNILGLSTQVPAKWTDISDGRYITYSFDGIEIEFKKRSNAKISGMSLMTALVIQAIKSIGKDNVTEALIHTIRKKLNEEIHEL